jgi:phosphoserine phosphatase RsbU/P
MSVPPVNETHEILIVDDKPSNLRLLSQILSEHGYKVRAVTSGARAFESAQTSPPSLILLDIRMPGMDGFEVCQRLKSDEKTRDVPVIFISALDDVQDKLRAFRMGGVDYITKPFQIDEVLARSETHLALRELQQQLQQANRRYQRELDLAGQIQASFLPRTTPDYPGWEIATRLIPSRETSGDFFDFIQLPDKQLRVIMADVVDKGAGAALIMALSWSLMRTYVVEEPSQPGRVFELVNRRLLQDVPTSLFVTLFFGLLDPESGTLVYANAGHCPALLLREGGEVQRLKYTGMPLGVLERNTWEQKSVQLERGDVLVLYTDGISEAYDPQDPRGDLLGLEHLQAVVKAGRQYNARHLLEHILSEVYAFTHTEHLADDIALIVMKRSA